MSSEKEQIVKAIAKFKSELIFDEFMGVFEKVSAQTKELLEQQYNNAIQQASEKLNIPIVDLAEEIETLAMESINGRSFSQDDLEQRIQEYQI